MTRLGFAALCLLFSSLAQSQAPPPDLASVPPPLRPFVYDGTLTSIDIAAATPRLVLGGKFMNLPGDRQALTLQYLAAMIATIRPNVVSIEIVDEQGNLVQSISPPPKQPTQSQ